MLGNYRKRIAGDIKQILQGFCTLNKREYDETAGFITTLKLAANQYPQSTLSHSKNPYREAGL
jgi:hypothetical protein